MPPILLLQLDRYGLTELVCRVKGVPAAGQQVQQKVELTSTIEVRLSENKVNAKIRVTLTPDPSDGPGYEIDATLVGEFSLPDGADLKECDDIIRRNAAAILYGVLRGQITLILGAFYGPKLFLPTLSMDQLFKNTTVEPAPVPEVEKKPMPKKRVPRKRPA